MSAEIRKTLIENALSCAEDSCIFAFQGGKPVLAGVEWFQDFVERQWLKFSEFLFRTTAERTV